MATKTKHKLRAKRSYRLAKAVFTHFPQFYSRAYLNYFRENMKGAY